MALRVGELSLTSQVSLNFKSQIGVCKMHLMLRKVSPVNSAEACKPVYLGLRLSLEHGLTTGKIQTFSRLQFSPLINWEYCRSPQHRYLRFMMVTHDPPHTVSERTGNIWIETVPRLHSAVLVWKVREWGRRGYVASRPLFLYFPRCIRAVELCSSGFWEFLQDRKSIIIIVVSLCPSRVPGTQQMFAVC